jgi:hypothetical protein
MNSKLQRFHDLCFNGSPITGQQCCIQLLRDSSILYMGNP